MFVLQSKKDILRRVPLTSMQKEKPSHLSVAAVDGFLREHGFKDPVKLIILGNSGVGKSFFCNALVQQTTFSSRVSSTSVTDNVECDVLEHERTAFVVYNIPGLIEADPKNSDRNRRCIEQAFRHLPEAKTVIVFIISQEGGRPRNEDIAAWLAIQAYVPQLQLHTVSFIVNRINKEDFDSGKDWLDYQAATERLIKEQVGRDANITFTYVVPKQAREDYGSGPMVQLRLTVLSKIDTLVRAHVVPEEGSELRLEKEVLQQEMSNLRQKMEDDARRFKQDCENMTAEHQEALKKSEANNAAMLERMRETHQREIEAVKKTLEENKSRLDEAKQALERERAEGQRRSNQMDPTMMMLMGLLSQQQQHQQAPMMMMPQQSYYPGDGFSGGSPGRAAPRMSSASGGLDWNAYRRSVKGMGMTQAQIQTGYHAQKR